MPRLESCWPLLPQHHFSCSGRASCFPFFAPLASAWLTAIAAASYQHFVVRRALRQAETERHHYQQAIHFVTHEMRTPLTAIQGSSELMGRYNLSEEKRKQMSEMINQESKRLARMIQTFLDVERLSDGQMELKREAFEVREIVEACVSRARPLAERKNIRIVTEALDGSLEGDRELMEYAVYNLLTNAVKYSPPDTQITVACRIARRRNCGSPSKTRASAWTPRSCARSSRSFTAPSEPRRRAKRAPASAFPSSSRSSSITAERWK